MRVLTLGSAEVSRLKVNREKDKLEIRETESRSGKYETWSALPVLKRDGYKIIILDVKNLDPISRLISVSYKAKEYLIIREDAVVVNSPALTLRYFQYIPKLLQASEMSDPPVPMEEDGERKLDDLDSSLLDLCSVNSRILYKRLRFEVEPDEISYLGGPVGAGKRELVALVLTGYLLVDDYRTIFITASKPSAVGDLFYFIQKGLEVRLVEGEGFYLSADENDNVVKLSILTESSKCRMVKTVQFVYPEEVGQLITPEILVWQGFNDLPDDLIVSTLSMAKQRTIVVNSDMGGYVSVGQVKSLGILDRLSTAKKIREYKLEGNLCKIWSELFLLQAPMILPLDIIGLPVGHECVVYRIVKKLVLVNPEHQEFVGNLVSILAGSMDSFDIDVVLNDWLLGSEYEIFVMMPRGDRRILGACVLKIGTSAYFDKMAREYNIQDEVWSESLVSLVWIAVHPAVRARGYGAQMVSKILRKMNTKISVEDVLDNKLLLENSVTDNETDFSLMAIEFVVTDLQTSFWNSFAPECEFLWSSLPESKGVITVGMFKLKGSLDWVNHIRFRDQWVQRLSGPYNKINVRLATNVVLYQTTKGIDSIDDESVRIRRKIVHCLDFIVL